MSTIIMPSWEDLNEILTSAQQRVLICSPYYSAIGVNKVFDTIGRADRYQFWTRLSPSDWAAGRISPESLLALVDLLQQNNRTSEIAIDQRLHAKAYAADYSLALIGSANLSEGGFGGNLELLVRFENDEASATIRAIENNIGPSLRHLSIYDFRQWVERNKPIIEQIRSIRDTTAESLQEVQRSLDEILGYGQAAHLVRPVDDFSHDNFGTWLENNMDLPGAETLYNRHHNYDGQNLTGHFKQSFYAVAGYLLEHGEYIHTLVTDLDQIEPDEVYDIAPAVLNGWIDYFNDHATQSGENYDFAILRGILPPSVGGTRTGGGGGIGTFKRMLPLVARYLHEAGYGNE